MYMFPPSLALWGFLLCWRIIIASFLMASWLGSPSIISIFYMVNLTTILYIVIGLGDNLVVVLHVL